MTTNPIPPPPPKGYESWIDAALTPGIEFRSDAQYHKNARAELAELRRQEASLGIAYEALGREVRKNDEMRELLRERRTTCGCSSCVAWEARVAKALGEERAH